MAKIEKYSLDESLTADDRLFGSSYQPGGSYSTASYTLGQLSEYMATSVGEVQEKWKTMSYKFSGQDLYNLNNRENPVLDLDPASSGNNNYWVLLPGVDNKILWVSELLVYVKKGSIPYDVPAYFNFGTYNHGDPSYIQTSSGVQINNYYNSDFYYVATSMAMLGNNLPGKPFLLGGRNDEQITEGDGEFGIFLQYRYLDFNTDF